MYQKTTNSIYLISETKIDFDNVEQGGFKLFLMRANVSI